jgi:hypothetical protein
MSPIEARVKTEVAVRTPPATDRRAIPPAIVERWPDRTTADASSPEGPGRREVIARAIVEIVDRAIADQDALEIALARPGGARSRGVRSRVVINGPDAVAHLLLPPSGDAFAEA